MEPILSTLTATYNIEIIPALILSYLVGSISFGVIITRLTTMDDIRAVGSGNIGATNVLRTGNKKAAVGTLLLDAGKGYVVVLVLETFFEPHITFFGGMCVFMGHLFPIFHGLKGGKGVATFIGILFALNVYAAGLVCLIWLCVAIIFKISSLSALVSSFAAPFIGFTIELEHLALITALVIIVWLRHIPNIKRLIRQQEPKISLRRATKLN